jgi:peptidoglycan hydrolase-like protein with peptidoglycan-binding domain
MNEKMKKYGLPILAILFIGGLTFWYLNKKKKESDTGNIESKNEGKETEYSGLGRVGTAPAKTVFPLKYGSSGRYVIQLQKWLNENIKQINKRKINQGEKESELLKPIAVDGIFGKETEKALITVTGKNTMSKEYYENAKIDNL